MKVTFELTLDGLTRALRGLAHDIAGRIEERSDRTGEKAKTGHERGA